METLGCVVWHELLRSAVWFELLRSVVWFALLRSAVWLELHRLIKARVCGPIVWIMFFMGLFCAGHNIPRVKWSF